MKIVERIVTNPVFQRVVSKRRVSAFFGLLANTALPRFVLKKIVGKFINDYQLNIDDYDVDIDHIKTFNEFFTRKYKSNRLNFSGSISSPAEGIITSAGSIEDGSLLQAKGISYSLKTLLHGSFGNAKSYITIYLSAANYHRVHAPFDLTIKAVTYISGDLHSVNIENIDTQKKIYTTNERVVLNVQSQHGECRIVLIGAMLVGKIKIHLEQYVSPENIEEISIFKNKGEELALFEMGSTIILMMDSNNLADCSTKIKEKIKLGEALC